MKQPNGPSPSISLTVFLFSWDRHSAKRRGHPALALRVLLPWVVVIVFL